MRLARPFRFALASAMWVSAATALLSAAPAVVPAADLGVRGQTWPVAEPDLLEEIEARLSAMRGFGRAGAPRSAGAVPRPFAAGATRPGRRRRAGAERRSRLFDPAIVVDRDIRTPDGTLIAAAGTRLDPLAGMTLARDLLFIDGRRDAEIAWALAHGRPAKIVLLAGRPLDLARAEGRPFFFDQGGRLAARFGLRFTPALVTQEGSNLRITEIPLEDREDRP